MQQAALKTVGEEAGGAAMNAKLTRADLEKEFDLPAVRRHIIKDEASSKSDPRIASALAGLDQLKAEFHALPDSDPRVRRLLAAYQEVGAGMNPTISKIIATFCFDAADASHAPEIDAFIEILTSALVKNKPPGRTG